MRKQVQSGTLGNANTTGREEEHELTDKQQWSQEGEEEVCSPAQEVCTGSQGTGLSQEEGMPVSAESGMPQQAQLMNAHFSTFTTRWAFKYLNLFVSIIAIHLCIREDLTSQV